MLLLCVLKNIHSENKTEIKGEVEAAWDLNLYCVMNDKRGFPSVRSTVNETAGKLSYALRLGHRNSGDNSKNNEFRFSSVEGFSVIWQSVFNPEKQESHSGTLMAYCKSLYINKAL